MAALRDTIEALLNEAGGFEDTFSTWQTTSPPSLSDIRRGKREYDSWYARAKKVVPADRLDEFIDMYEGGAVIKRIRSFLTDPLSVNPFYDEADPNPLLNKWVHDFGSSFRDSFVRQEGILAEALESDLPVTRMLEELAVQFARLPEFLATINDYDNDNVPVPSIMNEADLQVIVHALLRLLFDDVREEDPVPKSAGASSRVDFSIPAVGIVIETKMTRRGLSDKKVGEELLIDWGRYSAHPDCAGILALVYDPDRHIKNAAALETDLSQSERSPATLVAVIR